MIAWLSGQTDLVDQAIDVVLDDGSCSHRRQGFAGIPAEVGAVAEDGVGFARAIRQLGFHRAQLHRVRTRFQYGKNATASDLAAQAGNRGGDGGRVVGKVVVDRNPPHDPFDFHAALDVLEARQGIQPLRRRHADMAGGQQGSAGIGAIVIAGKIPARAADQAIRAVQNQFAACIVAADPIAVRVVETFDRGPAAALQHALQAGFRSIRNDQPGLRECADKMVKLRLDRRQITENVGMIEFQVIQNSRPGAVMDEFRALVAESSVVFVGFDDEERGIAKAGRDAEIERYTADQEAGCHVGVFQYPRQHRTGRRLAVGAGDAEYPAPLQYVLSQPLGAGDVGQPLVEYGFEQRVAARNGVADDEDVRLQSQLIRSETFDQFDACVPQLVAHGRIDVGIAAGDLVPRVDRQLCDAAHEGAADTENMNVHVTETR
ncbi:hypothetical protein SDC9_119456 [bioreactor metagenome]|uniref:Uncharacterized protein n=1 Tax=bioreactor metagenome TaxID=1076179 RepID=A0A645C3X8_9ZZZZ